MRNIIRFVLFPYSERVSVCVFNAGWLHVVCPVHSMNIFACVLGDSVNSVMFP